LRPGSHLWLMMKGLRFANPTYAISLGFIRTCCDSWAVSVNTRSPGKITDFLLRTPIHAL